MLDKVRRRLNAVFYRLARKAEPPLLKQARIITALRTISNGGDHNVILPTKYTMVPPDHSDLKIGFCGNIANNLYQYVRTLQSEGIKAELLIELDGIDNHFMNHPSWEDVPVEGDWINNKSKLIDHWSCPEFVKELKLDKKLKSEFLRDPEDGIYRAARLYREAFDKELPADLLQVFQTIVQHWNTLKKMGDYDVMVLSGAAIQLGPFCPVPFIILPTGGDRHIAPFKNTESGLLMRAGYKYCQAVLDVFPYFSAYYSRLGVKERCCRSTFLMDTKRYCSLDDVSSLKHEWQKKVGGDFFVFAICRQDWTFKGNDKVIKAFSKLKDPDVRLVLSEWGEDISKSKDLIHELNLRDKVLWLPVASKPIVRDRMKACDLVVDQVAMPGIGTSPIEALATAKRVIMNLEQYWPDEMPYEKPPLIPAKNESEVFEALQEAIIETRKSPVYVEGRNWAIKARGAEAIPLFMDIVNSVVMHERAGSKYKEY